MTSVSTAFQRATASAPPACKRRRRSTPTTSTSSSTAPKSTATWCSSSPGSKGEARENACREQQCRRHVMKAMRWPWSVFTLLCKVKNVFASLLNSTTHHHLETHFLSLEFRQTYFPLTDGQKSNQPHQLFQNRKHLSTALMKRTYYFSASAVLNFCFRRQGRLSQH